MALEPGTTPTGFYFFPVRDVIRAGELTLIETTPLFV